MSGIDFRALDELISVLEKKTSLNPGSPPVYEDGVLGIWRTIRGFRTFLELTPGAGKYNFEGKQYKGGRVMVGPPSLTGKDIGSVDNETWGKLSGSGTKETFSSASPEGIKALKQSVRNSLKSDDTRHKALADEDSLPKLIQIARSAGFVDQEIKEALDGKVFQNALGGKTKDEPAPDNVIDFNSKKKQKEEATAPADEEAEMPKAVGAENTPEPAPPSKPEDPSNPPASAVAVGGEDIHHVLDALKVPGILNADKKRKIADDLESAAAKVKDAFFRKQIEGYANGLRTGDYKIEEVRQSVKSLLEHRKKALLANLSDADLDKLHDKAKAKDAVKELKEHVAESAKKPQTAEVEAADRYFYEQQLEKLAAAIRDQKVAAQVREMRQQVRRKRLGGNSLILRLLQILRLILAFIPG